MGLAAIFPDDVEGTPTLDQSGTVEFARTTSLKAAVSRPSPTISSVIDQPPSGRSGWDELTVGQGQTRRDSLRWMPR